MEGAGICLFQMFFMGAIFAIVFAVGHFNKKAIEEAWGRFSERYGLYLTKGTLFSNPRVGGKYKGLDYSLFTFTRGSGKNKSTYTAIEMKLPHYDNVCHLHVYPEGFLSKIGKALGTQDIQIGDSEFDAAFMIKSRTPDRIMQVLTPELKRQMLNGKHLINISLSGSTIYFEKLGVIKDLLDLEYVSETMYHMGKIVLGDRGIPQEEKREIPSYSPYGALPSSVPSQDSSYEQAGKFSQPSSYNQPQEPSYEQAGNFSQPSSYNQPQGSSYQQDNNYYGGSDFTGGYEEKTGGGGRICTSCSAEVPPDNAYCINCGKKM